MPKESRDRKRGAQPAGRARPARVKWESVVTTITERIAAGAYSREDYLPAERELAENLQVSRPTVRRAIQALTEAGVLRTVPGVGNRITAAAREEPSWKVVALTLPDITNRFFVEVTEAIEYTLLQRGYQLLLGSYRHQAAVRDLQLSQLALREVKGVILGHESTETLPDALNRLRERSIPAVVLFGAAVGSAFDNVVIDEREGVEQVMRYLYSLDHRRIGYCRPVASGKAHIREIAFRDWMSRASLPVRDEWVAELEDLEGEGQRFRQMLGSEGAPTALFAGNDRVALLAMKHIAAAGLRIPEDISLVGFDNLTYTEHLPIPLTTVDQPKELMGRRAAELLLDRIEMGMAGAPRREVYPPRLVIRSSCARARE